MSKKIQLLGKISGTRNEVPWPPHLSVIELPEGEAVDLIKSGQARETDDRVTDADFGNAVFVAPEAAVAPNATGGTDKATEKALKEQATQIAELTKKLEAVTTAQDEAAKTASAPKK